MQFAHLSFFKIDNPYLIVYNSFMENEGVRKVKILRLCALLAVPAAIAAAVWLLLHIAPYRCPFRTHLGVLCFGCGLTRAFGALFSGQVLKSVRYNPLAIVLLITGILYYIEQWLHLFGKKVTLLPKNKWLWISVAALYVIYCIIRNIPAFAFLSIA
ncbi:MAG: DUF2752 domain-containing protein [Ruminococcaceae bacterium]|nr:DUF2752 domain-containing protein [Oscillospiraceae bacterium]